jgi:hypothetical protein
MSYRSQSDLVQEVLENLGVLPAGQQAQLEDTARVVEKLPSIVASVAAREIVYIPDVNAIPQHYFIPFSVIVAYECKEKFGISADALAALTQDNQNAILQLRVMNRGRPTFETLKTDYL